MGLRGAMLKKGQQVAKTVTVADYGDQVTGEIRKRELRFKTVPRDPQGPGYDFDSPTASWACEMAFAAESSTVTYAAYSSTKAAQGW
jgi:hypothetical protein